MSDRGKAELAWFRRMEVDVVDTRTATADRTIDAPDFLANWLPEGDVVSKDNGTTI